MELTGSIKIFSLTHANFQNAQRLFQYGDAITETLAYHPQRHPLYLKYHNARLQYSAKKLTLKGQIPTIELIIKTAILNFDLTASSSVWNRIKIIIAREGGGLYSPQQNTIVCFYTVQQIDNFTPFNNLESVLLGKTIMPCYHSLSPHKTCSAIHYIVAATEKQKLNVDDLVLRNYQNNLTEATSSNIFLQHKDGKIYTPSLSSGCQAGTTRSAFINYLKAKGAIIKVQKLTQQHLAEASGIALTNGMGIRLFKKWPNDRNSLNEYCKSFSDIYFGLNLHV